MTNISKNTLEHVALIIEAIVPLLIKSGVGYNELSSACKPIFYRQALIEAKRNGHKTTDSAISLLSGLHRRDTASLRKAIIDDPCLADPPISKPVSITKQVISQWLALDLPETITIHEEKLSFSYLVAKVSKDQHYRSILNELERLGLVIVNDKHVTLTRNSYTPDPSQNESQEQFSQNVSDHISAGLVNLFANPDSGDTGVLEQAIFSDELTLESVEELNALANELWKIAIDTILKKAVILHERDKNTFEKNPNYTPYRFRLGVYAYNETDLKQTVQFSQSNK